jgi:hypothetical protein
MLSFFLQNATSSYEQLHLSETNAVTKVIDYQSEPLHRASQTRGNEHNFRFPSIPGDYPLASFACSRRNRQ